VASTTTTTGSVPPPGKRASTVSNSWRDWEELGSDSRPEFSSRAWRKGRASSTSRAATTTTITGANRWTSRDSR
jgi:hypothetical protein